MTYLERALNVKAAISFDRSKCDQIRKTFAGHLTGNARPWKKGIRRAVYGVGTVSLPGNKLLYLLLKLAVSREQLLFANASIGCAGTSIRDEMGAMETYYDFVDGRFSTLVFPSEDAHARGQQILNSYPNAEGLKLGRSFSLCDWPGTVIGRGDVGGLPYFQLAVKCGGHFGLLTEGIPCDCPPQNTVSPHFDEKTTYGGRIVDLGAEQSLLVRLDCAVKLYRDSTRRTGELDVCSHGDKYFFSPNRLDIAFE